ncbi:MAG: Abnormal spindle-like microcephaly-assocd, ASPM-SPD-2-Hydin [Chloroflexota bacterium]|nr:Abnormal spindle-like microcephaly-assocd, ASPM-SPD-2-Hydin [Chloroflexota bacterium]
MAPVAIDFGIVDVGTTSAPAVVTITNTGGDPFGPINIFGGAPPTDEFNASQTCQGTTLPAAGTCEISYTFAPTAEGMFTDSSSFTLSETASQADGFDFTVSLAGCGASGPAAILCVAPPAQN